MSSTDVGQALALLSTAIALDAALLRGNVLENNTTSGIATVTRTITVARANSVANVSRLAGDFVTVTSTSTLTTRPTITITVHHMNQASELEGTQTTRFISSRIPGDKDQTSAAELPTNATTHCQCTVGIWGWVFVIFWLLSMLSTLQLVA